MPKMIDPDLKARAVRLMTEHQQKYPSLTAAAAAVAKHRSGPKPHPCQETFPGPWGDMDARKARGYDWSEAKFAQLKSHEVTYEAGIGVYGPQKILRAIIVELAPKHGQHFNNRLQPPVTRLSELTVDVSINPTLAIRCLGFTPYREFVVNRPVHRLDHAGDPMLNRRGPGPETSASDRLSAAQARETDAPHDLPRDRAQDQHRLTGLAAHSILLPTVQQYVTAFRAVEDRITPNQLRMLEFHAQPARAVSATKLAAHMGRSSYSPANLQYGKLGALLGHELGIDVSRYIWVALLVDFVASEKAANAQYLWVPDNFITLRPRRQHLRCEFRIEQTETWMPGSRKPGSPPCPTTSGGGSTASKSRLAIWEPTVSSWCI